ncbi:unnamed protein product [Coffea canephora]|uniref:non-specific serine/threonine protein kinase n=1 Tax=Coffea canephora TaxID=49390 RepID=A0A068URV2_COFCA|nr:unnamed protein product [Coffea canephora]
MNRFTGPIPSKLFNVSSLRVISMVENDLSGSLPSSLGAMLPNLEELYIGGNRLSGVILTYISNASRLAYLDLTSNQFTGVIPRSLVSVGNLSSNLESFYMNDCGLFGQIPSSIGNLSNLADLNLSQNALEGTIPPTFGGLLKLQEMELGYNKFQGPCPSELCYLLNLGRLSLSSNLLSGRLPSCIGNITSLRYLYLDSNNLSFNLPSNLWRLRDILELNLSTNSFSGSFSSEIENLKALIIVDLSVNNFFGDIPTAIGALQSLQALSLKHNRLQGFIPESMKNMLELHSRKMTVLLVLLALGSVVVAMVVSFLVIRKWRRKIVSPSNLDPDTTFERVSSHELRQITIWFSESALLGSGTFGSVYKGIQENGMTWAIKVFYLQLDGAFKSFNRECKVLRCLRHRNLTMVFSACSNPDFKALILEYMPNGSLEKRLYSGTHILNIMQRLDIMIDVACGLEYLHYGYPTPVIHCDLKPNNILLDQDMVGHVCDFGIAKLLGDGESVVQTKTLATFEYVAPEYGLEGLVSTSCDVYSFGMTLMETFTKRRPKDEMFTEELSLQHWIACISSILELALCCTADASKDRMTMKDVLKALQKIKLQFSEGLKPLK